MTGRPEDDWVRWMAGVTGQALGDDAAVISTSGSPLVVASDLLVEERHFRSPPLRPSEIGRKAVLRTLSDLAAMGARPDWVLLSVALPGHWSTQGFRALFRAAHAAAEGHGARLVGGDTSDSPGPLVADVAAGGTPAGPQAVLRSGARPGDALVVTGPLGGRGEEGWRMDRARVEEGVLLAATYGARAMMDLSDGLAADLPRLCSASGIGAEIEVVPLARAARAAAARDGHSALHHALCDGEDYELLAALPPAACEKALRDPRLDLTRLGTATSGAGIRIRRGDRLEAMEAGGHVRQF